MFNNFKTRLSRFSKEHPWWLSFLIILAFFAGSGPRVVQKYVIPSFHCQVKAQTAQFLSSSGPLNNQVIVTGTRADVEAVVGPLGLTLLEDCDLSYLNSRKAPNPELTAAQRKTLVMQLYEAPDGSTSEDVDNLVSQINTAREQNPDRYIFADRNFVTSLMDSYGTCYLPNGGGGSGGGTPYGDPGDIGRYDSSTAGNAFVNQWAFGNQGIKMTSTSDLTGRGVRVAVFDTSPYRIKVPSIILRRNKAAFPAPLWFNTWDTAGSTVVSNHGRFVVGQIQNMAPESSIRLIRVLNDDGCGELWVLNKALHDYTSRMSFWTGRLDRTVINLSLAVDTRTAPPDDVLTLATVIDEAHRRGAVIIAAAGNDSFRTTEPVKDMRYPAKYPNVIGVAAINKNGARSCYSNMGDVAAPGGDGGMDIMTDPANPDPCAPRAQTWDQQPDPCNAGDLANCKYGVISSIETRYGPRYVLWSGTSFAAPLVSGVAALASENWDQAAVECLIEQGARLHPATAPGFLTWGIVEVRNILSTTSVLSTCGVSP